MERSIASLPSFSNVDPDRQPTYAFSVRVLPGSSRPKVSPDASSHAHHVLGETVSLQPRIKLVKTRPGPLEGKHPFAVRIRERTGCSVVAVERGERILMDLAPSFILSPDDALYICGTTQAVTRYYDEYPASRL